MNCIAQRSKIFTGSDTTSTALCAALFYLTLPSTSPNPPLKQLQTLLRSKFATKTSITPKALSSIPLLRAIIDESLRLSPPVGQALWREVLSPLTVDSISLPAGIEVGVSIYAIHHNTDYFPDAYAFKPERWLTGPDGTDDEKKELRRAFAPFSLGPRNCIGRPLAYREMDLILARLCWEFDIKRAESHRSQGMHGRGWMGERPERKREDEFQMWQFLTASKDGPDLVFKRWQE
jgi:cytochrome P450